MFVGDVEGVLEYDTYVEKERLVGGWTCLLIRATELRVMNTVMRKPSNR